MITNASIRTYLRQLAGGEAAPGGGAAAALNGAQGAALISMVCNLTVGRKKYAEVEEEMEHILTQSEALRAQLTDLIEQDVSAFDGVMLAYQMPKSTPEEKVARSAAIQEGLKGATIVPLETLAACVDVLELAETALAKGNPNVVSDGGAGLLAAHAGMMTAAINVRINLNAIKDTAFVAEYETRMQALLARGDAARERAWTVAASRLGM